MTRDEQKTKAELLQELDSLRERVSELKQAKEKLHKSEQRYCSLTDDILDSSKVGIFILDDSFKVVWLNQALERYFGLRRKDVIGKDKRQLILKQIKDIFEEPETFVEKVFATYDNNTYIENFECHVLADGQLENRWLEHWSQPIRSGLFAGGRIEHYTDITERKKGEKALRDGKERLRVALSAAQMGTWRWDPVTNQDTRDANLNLILGLEAVESTQPVEDFLHFVHPEDRDMTNEEIQRAIRERRTYLAEFRIIRPDGTVRWLRDQGKLLCDENDRVLCLTGAVIDITEHKKAENELKESEERFRAIFDNAADGIILADMESKKFHGGNKVMGQMLGCDPGEIKNLRVVDIHPEEDLPYVIEQFEKQSRGPFTLSRDISVKRKDGSFFYADINSVTITLRGKTYLMGIFRDVTERKRAEETVRDSESKYRTLVENLPQKIFLKDKNSVYVSCNDNLARDLKIRSEEIVGKTDYDFFSKKLAEKYRADDKRIIESGQTEAIEEKYIQEGKEKIVHTVKTPVKDEQGNTIGVLGIFWDITELKRREEELNIYRENMVRAEELAAVGTLSATLAHELSQPLTVIRLSIQNSLAELETMSCPGTIVEDLKKGLSEISSVTSIIDRFRNFARNSSKITIREVDLKAVAERIVKLLDEIAWLAKVTLQVKGMDILPPIYSHEKDLERLFFSLVENSIQAADGKKSRQVIISGAIRDEHIELQFSDNCGGIAPENLERIFEPFFTTKHTGERTGLGLCVVERIASQLNGKVRVESKLGKGSTFFVTLPIKGEQR